MALSRPSFLLREILVEKIAVLLVGPQGSGKSTYCREHLPGYTRISQDDQGKQAHFLLFEQFLREGAPFLVIDRINNLKSQRKRYLDLARQHGYHTRIIWLNVDRNTCLKRCRERPDHPTLKPEDAERALQTYFSSFQIPSRREADVMTIIGPPPYFVPIDDRTKEIGDRRHIIVGDIHGCYDELQSLLAQLNFDPAEDVLVSVGDIIDRGPKVRETIDFLFSLPRFHMVIGNHEEKLLRYLEGRNVKPTGGMQTTIDAYDGRFPLELAEQLRALPLILRTPSGIVVHAGFDPEMPPDEQGRADCLYMRFYGGKTYFDEINGRAWFTLWPAELPRVFFGHIPLEDGPAAGNIYALDAGCVFGGRLRAFDSRDGQIHSVPAAKVHSHSEYGLVKHVAPNEVLRRREEYVIAGLLRTDRTDDGRLAIYTYTDQCVFANAWDDITRNARGHIYDTQTGECVAAPFPKFFNLGENEESLPEKFPWHEPYEIYEKMDGWLGVLYRHDGRYQISSRGSFHSSGAVWASQHVQRFDLSVLPDEATLCFEIIHPEHKIILNYSGQETLIILAAFNRRTGEEYPRALVAEWANEIGLPIVPLLASMSLEDLLHLQKNRENFEGFVLRFNDGRRVKVKTEWYLNMARIMSNLTPIALWEVMQKGKVRQDYLVQIPEELRPLAERYQAILEGQYARTMLNIERVSGPILKEHAHERRALARHLDERKKELGYLKSAIFMVHDKKFDQLDKFVMDRIYPKGNQFTAEG